MAYSLTDSGVLSRTGKGKKAVELLVSFKEIEAWAKRMRAKEKELWRLSYGRAISGIKSKLRKVMKSGGGVEGVPKFKDFEDFTKELRVLRGRSGPMGGVLAKDRCITAWKCNGSQYIGWPDGMADVAHKFQEGRGGPIAEKWFADSEWRQAWHRRGIKDVPRAYVHNERMVIEPYFVDYIKRYLDEWARGAYYKGLVKLMQGGKDADRGFARYVG